MKPRVMFSAFTTVQISVATKGSYAADEAKAEREARTRQEEAFALLTGAKIRAQLQVCLNRMVEM